LLEEGGIATVVVAIRAFRDRLKAMRLPRTVITPHPMGRPLGAPGDADRGRMVIGELCTLDSVARFFAAIDATLRYVQKVTMALKYSPIPVVAAPFGRVLGGGVEVCLHCDRIQAEANVGMGLVETSVGLIPGAGGIKESLLRAMALRNGVNWPFP
jgi:hypothetical protein